jgi:hypothetical protein
MCTAGCSYRRSCVVPEQAPDKRIVDVTGQHHWVCCVPLKDFQHLIVADASTTNISAEGGMALFCAVIVQTNKYLHGDLPVAALC